MSTEQQIASVVVGWVFVAMAFGVAYWVRWLDRVHDAKEAERRREEAGPD